MRLRRIRLFNAADDEAAPGDVSARLFAGCRQAPSLVAEAAGRGGVSKIKARSRNRTL